MITQLIVDAVLTGQTVLGATYYLNKQRSGQVSMQRLREQGFTIAQIANIFQVNHITVFKTLSHRHDIKIEDIDDRAGDWANRYYLWCRAHNLHYELGPCHFCNGCKSVSQAVKDIMELKAITKQTVAPVDDPNSYLNISHSSFWDGSYSSDTSDSDLWGPHR